MKILKRSAVLAVLVVLAGSVVLLASPDIKLRLLEGVREGTSAGPTAVTSSYEKLDMWGTLPADYSLDLEIAKIKKVFNMKDVKLITEANLSWPAQGDKVSHIIQFEGREFLVLVNPRGEGAASKFRVEVFEQKGKDKKQTNLLDTVFQLPAEETVYLGFEDTTSNAYFLYLTWPGLGIRGGVSGGVTGGVAGGISGGVTGGVEGGVQGGIEGGVTGGIAGGIVETQDAAAPRLLKKIEPVYSEIARQLRVEGVVVLSVTTDVQGKVSAVKVLRSVPLLEQSAFDAVKQWVYEPVLVQGKPQPSVFQVTLTFKLVDKEKKAVTVGGTEAVRAVGDVNPPKLIKEVAPVYPEIAKQAAIEGVVILEATTNIYGRVIDTKILRSIPLLDQAAIKAVKQWVYEPVKIGGEPKGIIFTVTVAFRLDDKSTKGQILSWSAEDEEFAKGAVKAEGEIKPPRLVKEAVPIYPLEAQQAQVSGVVILAARLDVEGKVKAVRILRSIPKLDQAAIDAVRQWEYEPLLVKGKPVEVVFTVTVRFYLKKTG